MSRKLFTSIDLMSMLVVPPSLDFATEEIMGHKSTMSTLCKLCNYYSPLNIKVNN